MRQTGTASAARHKHGHTNTALTSTHNSSAQPRGRSIRCDTRTATATTTTTAMTTPSNHDHAPPRFGTAPTGTPTRGTGRLGTPESSAEHTHTCATSRSQRHSCQSTISLQLQQQWCGVCSDWGTHRRHRLQYADLVHQHTLDFCKRRSVDTPAHQGTSRQYLHSTNVASGPILVTTATPRTAHAR